MSTSFKMPELFWPPAAPNANQLLRGETVVPDGALLAACIWPAGGEGLYHLVMARRTPAETSFHLRPGSADFSTILASLPDAASTMAWQTVPAEAERMSEAFRSARASMRDVLEPETWMRRVGAMALLPDQYQDQAIAMAEALRPLNDADRLASLCAQQIRYTAGEHTPAWSKMVAAVIECLGSPRIGNFETAAVYSLSVWPAHQAAAREWADLHERSGNLDWFMLDPVGFTGARVAIMPGEKM